MNKQIIIKGKKSHMSQVFTPEGKVIPVTILKMLDELSLEMQEASIVLTGKSKGKGFTGVMKKWNFSGGPATRGQSDKARAAGSIGSQTPSKVWKGKKMAGKHGNKKVTIKSSKVIKVDVENKELTVSGPVPGARNSDVLVKFA